MKIKLTKISKVDYYIIEEHVLEGEILLKVENDIVIEAYVNKKIKKAIIGSWILNMNISDLRKQMTNRKIIKVKHEKL